MSVRGISFGSAVGPRQAASYNRGRPLGRYSTVETVRLRCTPARWHSPPFRYAHRLSLLFSRLIRHNDAPGLSLCSRAGGCPGPLLTPCFASCLSLLIVYMSNDQ